MIPGISSAQEVSVVILLFLILLVGGLFFVVRGLRLPPNYEKNMARRKEIRRKIEEREEQKGRNPEEDTPA